MGRRLGRVAALASVSVVLAATATLAGVAPAAFADVGPVNPVRVPLNGHPANSGFLVFVEGDAFLNADESEGTIAVGGDLAFGTAYNVAARAQPAQGTFTAPGDARDTYLYVGGGMNFSQADGGDILRVQNQGFTKIADAATFSAFDRDQNNATINYRITAPGATAETIPRIEGTVTQTPASIATPVPASLIDIPAAFDLYRGLSSELATCPNTVVLTDDAGNALTSPFAQGARGHVTLAPNQTNVLTITAADLGRLGELAFDDQPSLTAPLLVNVTGTSFTGTMPNSPGISSAQAPYILYNFAEATSITVTGGDSIEGTLYAPRADLRWVVTQNIEGNVVAASFTHGNPLTPIGAPREVHDLPFAAELSCTTTPVPDAELTLVKVVDGGPASPGDWTLSADGPTPISGASGDAAVTNAVVTPGDYMLSESGGPTDYTSGGWSCVGASVVGGVVTLASGDAATCTIVNTFVPPPPPPDPELTLVKVVDGGPASPDDWTLSADGPTPITGSSGDAAVTDAVATAGDYTLGESGGPAGYTSGDWSCVGATVVGGVVTLAAGDDATCTIVNTFAAGDPKLTLVKVVKGGTATPTDWVLSATGTTPITGVTGSVAVTVAEVLPGEYTLSESGGPDGYSAGSWACTGGSAPASGSSATIAIDWGDAVVCTITNTFVPPTLPTTGVDVRLPVASGMLLVGLGGGLISFRMIRRGRARA